MSIIVTTAPSRGTPAHASPPRGAAEHWAELYLTSRDLEYKLSPPAVPPRWASGLPSRRHTQPGRPPELEVLATAPRMPKPAALVEPEQRAKLIHTFLHHELQAAELMCFAVLAFPETAIEFRRGLLAIARDEIRHMQLYRTRLRALGFDFGSFGVRDWIWQRGSQCQSPLQFVAFLGMGLEAANLDHAERYASLFFEANDAETARVTERIGHEEVAHVGFAVRWFERWRGSLDFAAWCDALPPPLSPLLMRGEPLAERARQKAGMPPAFIDALARWKP